MTSTPHPGTTGTDPFLVLQENRFAFTAIASLGTKPSADLPRPIFIYGPSGVGKSHLARNGIRLLLRRKQEARFVHLIASQYAAEFAEAASRKAIHDFQAATRNCELLILEDIHGLEGRTETQRQLLALVDDLAASGCHIVWTCRKSPGELADFLPKLINRFHAGVMAPLRLPSLESRISLLNHFANNRQVPLSAEVAKQLASALPVSPRELLATILQLEVQARSERRSIDSDFVRKFLASGVQPTGIALPDIARTVAQHFSITVNELRSRSRLQGLVLPRQFALFLSRELTPKGLTQIGRYYGNRDHSTVVHACQRMATLLADEPVMRQHLNQIRSALGVEQADAV